MKDKRIVLKLSGEILSKKDKSATRYSEISYMDILNKKLNVMDATATSLCMDNNIPIFVFDINNPGNLVKAVKDQSIGTIVKN